jgi:hypothetical protein
MREPARFSLLRCCSWSAFSGRWRYGDDGLAGVSARRAEAGISQVIDVMRSARETAISQAERGAALHRPQRGAVDVDIGANGTQTGTTILRTVELENGVQFRQEPGVPDTPDLFGMASATDFDLAGPWMFTSEGTFVGGSGDVTNGTVFLSIPNQATVPARLP